MRIPVIAFRVSTARDIAPELVSSMLVRCLLRIVLRIVSQSYYYYYYYLAIMLFDLLVWSVVFEPFRMKWLGGAPW